MHQLTEHRLSENTAKVAPRWTLPESRPRRVSVASGTTTKEQMPSFQRHDELAKTYSRRLAKCTIFE